MAKHTEGPWKAFERTPIEEGSDPMAEGAWCGIESAPDDEGNTAIVAHVINAFSDQILGEEQANAKLIAAAPELLEACKLALEWMPKDVRSQIKRAIAKAE